MEEVLKELKPNDVFWDVGASFGFYSLLAASCASAVVMAFEPHPITVERLAKNIELNRKSNIQILQLALSDSKGKTRFNMIDSDINPGSSHLATDEINGTIEVETSRGDDLIENGTVPKPDIIKIDVEGAEHLVIKGMQSALPSCRVLFCEVHPNIRKYGSSAEDLEKILKNTGFRIEKIQERFDDTYHLKARR
jgi:FkbM family methyltransferase